MKKQLAYLDTYLLQQDMRIRMPKSILVNLDAKAGHTYFDVYFDQSEHSLVLYVSEEGLANGS